MMKWLDSPKGLFSLLRIAAAVAIIAGLYLGVSSGVAAVFQQSGFGTVLAWWHALTALVCCGLWAAAWWSFLHMCTRLMQGGTAFTKKNGRALLVISRCVCLLAAVMFARALPGLLTSPDVYSAVEAVVLPGVVLCVGAVAAILRSLLVSAMALEAEQADVV